MLIHKTYRYLLYVYEQSRVAEPKLFIFGTDSGSTYVHNFGSGSSSCHIFSL